MCICLQYMKFLRSNLWPGRLSTDDDNDNTDDKDDDNGQSMITQAFWHLCQVSPSLEMPAPHVMSDTFKLHGSGGGAAII